MNKALQRCQDENKLNKFDPEKFHHDTFHETYREEEQNRMRVRFCAMDLDGDGTVTEKEIEHVLQSLGICEHSGAIRSKLAKFDKNHDGVFDFEEFQTLYYGGVRVRESKKRIEEVENFSDSDFEKDAKETEELKLEDSMSDVDPSDLKVDELLKSFLAGDGIEKAGADDIRKLAKLAFGAFRGDDSLMYLKSPIIVVGDVHGQYTDLLRIFNRCGAPDWSHKNTQYLFLGDYVDRGEQSVEVISTLLALKVTYPKKVYMLRGNHENNSVNRRYGFKDECRKKVIFKHIK
eukprot:UN33746